MQLRVAIGDGTHDKKQPEIAASPAGSVNNRLLKELT